MSENFKSVIRQLIEIERKIDAMPSPFSVWAMTGIMCFAVLIGFIALWADRT